MASLDSDKVRAALTEKLGCEVDTKRYDHDYFFVVENGLCLSRTFVSKGAKHTLNNTLLLLMARQLRLGVAGNLVKFVSCTMDKGQCLSIIRATLSAEFKTIAQFSCPRCHNEIRVSLAGMLSEPEVRNRLHGVTEQCGAKRCTWLVRLIDANTSIKITHVKA